MSNLKKHFFHISKSWFSVCTFIFLLAVCVGLVIHITNKKENATCSNSEAPIVSNGNVSEESGSDIAHAENYVPTEEDVLVTLNIRRVHGIERIVQPFDLSQNRCNSL